MKEHIVLPALIEVKDDGWVFTILVAVVGDDKERWAGMVELTKGGMSRSQEQLEGFSVRRLISQLRLGLRGEHRAEIKGVKFHKRLRRSLLRGHVTRGECQWSTIVIHTLLI